MYKEIKPSNFITSYIQCYWIIETSELFEEQKHRVLPDGCFDIVITVCTHNDNSIILTGIWESPIDVTLKKIQRTVGIRFYPTAIQRFFTCNISDLKNTNVTFNTKMLNLVSPRSLSLLYESNDIDEIIEYIDFEFTQTAYTTNGYRDVFQHISGYSPQKNISDISKEAYLSSRQLRRLYKEKLGISPKTYTSILRFVQAKEMLLNNTPLVDITQTLHYYDQTHFTKEFKKFSGFTPKEFIYKYGLSDFYYRSI